MRQADSVVFRPLIAGDIDHVAQNLCPGELETLRDVGGAELDVKGAVANEVLLARTCEAWVVGGGKPLCIVGVRQVSLLEGIGNLWMLATAELFRHPRYLVVAGRRHVATLHRTYSVLIGRVDARRTGTRKWQQLLGFKVGEPVPEGPVDYCYYARRVEGR